MKRMIALLAVCAMSLSSIAAPADKTLVAWVMLDSSGLGNPAGSVLTIQRGDDVGAFDGIVFGEVGESKWMAGSEFYNRTQMEQDYPAETATDELIQIAIVYERNEIRIYRNGERLTSYNADNIDFLSDENQLVVFGLRHWGGTGYIKGAVEDARIYAEALSPAEIQELEPNQASEIEPWAWWDFEGNRVQDRTGRFKHTWMVRDAKVVDGRLELDVGEAMVTTRNEETMMWAKDFYEYEEQIPAMPRELPADWLTYHLVHPGPGVAHPGDPNAAFHYKDRYHLHYIYNNKYGACFAHVSSRDMVHWKWHPTTLAPPVTGHGMFSGTGFFTKEGQPAIIYHGVGSERNWIIYGQDNSLDKWTEPFPVLEETGQMPRYWDPDCWLRDHTYYAISGGAPPYLMKSTDLMDWSFLGKLFHEDTDWEALGVGPDEDVSCANMFKIGDKWMLLCISHRLGCRYYLGDFKDEKYLPESHHLMNWVPMNIPEGLPARLFAPESLLTQDGRRVMWAWVVSPMSSGLTGVQSLPWELSLPEDGELRIKPLRELEQLRGEAVTEGEVMVKSDEDYRLKKVDGDTLELSVNFEPTDSREYGVSVFCDENGYGFPITYIPGSNILNLGSLTPPLELDPGEGLNLRIFLDKEMIEVFANDRQAVVYVHPHEDQDTGIVLFSKGADLEAEVTAWPMETIYGGEIQFPFTMEQGDPVTSAWIEGNGEGTLNHAQSINEAHSGSHSMLWRYKLPANPGGNWPTIEMEIPEGKRDWTEGRALKAWVYFKINGPKRFWTIQPHLTGVADLGNWNIGAGGVPANEWVEVSWDLSDVTSLDNVISLRWDFHDGDGWNEVAIDDIVEIYLDDISVTGIN